MAARTTTTARTIRNLKGMDRVELLKRIETVGFALGPAVTVYYLAGFRVDEHGYYYKGTEFGIAVGVFLISLAWALRYWRRES
ncbi:MAG: hypothetical protein V3U03_01775 [Myxococcota bacterium]